MIAKNRAQLKAWIKNMYAKVDVNENIILQNYLEMLMLQEQEIFMIFIYYGLLNNEILIKNCLDKLL